MTLRITQYGESILHEKGKKVESFDEDLYQLYKDMLEAMLSDTGFDFCRRVRYELESIFPPSKQGLRRAAIN